MIERIEKEDIETQIYKDILKHLNHTTWIGEKIHQEIDQESLSYNLTHLPLYKDLFY